MLLALRRGQSGSVRDRETGPKSEATNTCGSRLKGNAMGSIQGFRCRRCRGEIVASADPDHPLDRAVGPPQVLCCGRPVRPVETAQVLSTSLPSRRIARCPGCGFQVRVIVRPEGPMLCRLCGREMITRERVPEREDRVHPPPGPMKAEGGPPA